MSVDTDGALVATIERGADLEVRVRQLSVDGAEFVDVREFVPSTETYGRGITMPLSLKKALIAALREV